MEIFETSAFTRQITQLLSEEGYRQLQNFLVINPLAGAVIPDSGGLRKIRWQIEGRGKRGGIRAIYYYASSDNRIFMLLAYGKGMQDDLTKELLPFSRQQQN